MIRHHEDRGEVRQERSSPRAVPLKPILKSRRRPAFSRLKRAPSFPRQDIGNYPPDKIVILSTGAQGEEFAALMRIATGQHKYITLNERDTIVLSSSVIPGNETRCAEIERQSLPPRRHAHPLPLERRPLDRPRQHRRARLDQQAGAREVLYARATAITQCSAATRRPSSSRASRGRTSSFPTTASSLILRTANG